MKEKAEDEEVEVQDQEVEQEKAQDDEMNAEDEEGNALYWRRVNLMTASEIILEPDEVARIKEI